MKVTEAYREICLCNGPAQFMVLAAALSRESVRHADGRKCERIFVLSAQATSQEFRKFFLALVERSGLASRIVCCWDWPEWNGFFGDQYLLMPYRFVRSCIGFQRVDRIWVARLPMPLDRLVACVYSSADLVVYEEGTLSYTTYPDATYKDYLSDSEIGVSIKLWLRRISRVNGLIGKVARNLSRHLLPDRSVLRPDLSARVREFHGVLPKNLGQPAGVDRAEIRIIGIDSLHQTKRFFPDIRHELPKPSDVGLSARALVLGLPCRHLQKQGIPLRAVHEFYALWTSKLVESGYQIVWKPHPRDVGALSAFLSKELGRAFIALDRSRYIPAELLYMDIEPNVVVASVSTSLYTAQTLYGLRVATYVRGMIKDLGYNARSDDLRKLEGVPDIESLFKIDYFGDQTP